MTINRILTTIRVLSGEILYGQWQQKAQQKTMQCSMKNLAGMRARSYQSFNCNIQKIQQKVSKTRKEFIDSHDQYSQPVCHLSIYGLSAPNSPFNICPVITVSFRVSPLKQDYVKCSRWRALEGLCWRKELSCFVELLLAEPTK